MLAQGDSIAGGAPAPLSWPSSSPTTTRRGRGRASIGWPVVPESCCCCCCTGEGWGEAGRGGAGGEGRRMERGGGEREGAGRPVRRAKRAKKSREGATKPRRGSGSGTAFGSKLHPRLDRMSAHPNARRAEQDTGGGPQNWHFFGKQPQTWVGWVAYSRRAATQPRLLVCAFGAHTAHTLFIRTPARYVEKKGVSSRGRGFADMK